MILRLMPVDDQAAQHIDQAIRHTLMAHWNSHFFTIGRKIRWLPVVNDQIGPSETFSPSAVTTRQK